MVKSEALNQTMPVKKEDLGILGNQEERRKEANPTRNGNNEL